MNLRPWVAAPLAGAAIALMSPSAGAAEPAAARHASGSLWRDDGDGHDQGHRNPWRDCRSHRRVVLVDKSLRAILTNGRRGPEALVLNGTSKSSSPVAPWDSWSVATYLDVKYPTQTSGQYEFEIRDFFRVHPLFVVKALDNHKRVFPFPVTHCRDGQDDREDRDGPHGGAIPDGSGKSGSPVPRKETVPGGTDSAGPRENTAAGWSAGLPSALYIVLAAGGLLTVLGMLATAWLRRRRSAE
ncbi:hypothetical protein [Streptomyces sp. NPDC046942]|uniref:hypothetical protein n=1 Tax=Streptomyces sp. NPDC046942 TaxID=3155137 RepID=UPI0033C2BC68